MSWILSPYVVGFFLVVLSDPAVKLDGVGTKELLSIYEFGWIADGESI